MRFLALFMLTFSFMSGSLKASYKEYAKERQKKEVAITKSASPSSIPGFQSATPPETNFNNPSSLESSTQNAFNENGYARDLKKTSETRQYFVIDLEKDPIISHSKNSIQNPEKVLSSDLYSRKLHTEYTFKTCRESKPPIEYKCSKTLLPPTIHIDPAKYSHYWCKKGHHGPDDPQCSAKKYYATPIMYQAEKVHISPEAWTSDCGNMHEEAKKRSCKLIKQVCPKGSETREVMATIGPQRQAIARQITRPCWRYEYTYACAYPSINTCEALRKSICEQISSKCINEMDGVCIEWEQTYRCPGPVNNEQERVSAGNFSLPQVDAPAAQEPNHDMAEAIAKLSVLKDIQDDLRANGNSQNASSIQIFKGERHACTIAFAGFKNCCTQKGWGVSLNLSGCDKEDKDLAEKQKKKLCVKVGTYCAEKTAFGICLRKKKSYCCFPTKLARLLHDQGRSQLGIGWGKPKHPQCRGFTIDELSSINFDQLDLSEIFSEIAARAKQITQTTVNTVTRNLSGRVSQMSHDFKSGLNPSGPSLTTKGVKQNELNKPHQGDF